MATIQKIKDRFRVQIRRKSGQFQAAFSTMEMAEIWAKYHDDLLDAIENFKAPPESYITLGECIELKVKDLEKRDIDKKTIADTRLLESHFSEFLNIALSEITPDALRNCAKEMANSTVRRGGNKNNNTGDMRKISPATLANRFRYLASVFNFIIEKGANLTNPAQIVVNQLKMSIIKRGESLEENDEE